ncbi:MAG: hypothetical protein B7733_08145 [Myxococcales bacterium FL481]|nr:MAG: hypothetical protein B7733_08145 [Myxococcales bacterium FL481]
MASPGRELQHEFGCAQSPTLERPDRGGVGWTRHLATMLMAATLGLGPRPAAAAEPPGPASATRPAAPSPGAPTTRPGRLDAGATQAHEGDAPSGTETGSAAPATDSAPLPSAPTRASPSASNAPESAPNEPYVPATELPSEAPRGGSVAGPVISAEDENARRASGELEGQGLDPQDGLDLPQRASPLARAGWGALVGGAAALVTAGLAAYAVEREEERAARVAALIDPSTGKQPTYSAAKDEYEDHLDRGRAFSVTAQVMLAAGAAAVTTSVVLLLIDHKRGGRQRWAVGPTGVEVRF